MTDAPPLSLLAELAEVAGRPQAARALARKLGADELLLLVRDPELGVLLPAPGFPQTWRGGATWRAFLATCAAPGRHRSSVQLRDGEPPVAVLGHVGADGATLVLIGGAPLETGVDALLPALPLLCALLRAEAAAHIAEGNAAAARDAGRHARDLARALDTTRGDLEGSLRESARLNRELQHAGRRKDEFLAMLGHELRNPMAAITSALELMRVRPDTLEILGKARAVIERQSQQLSHLIDDLLDVARVTRGKIALRRQPIELDEVLRRAVETTHTLMNAKMHRLHVRYAPSLRALADPTRLEQIATNLLSNAAKYTDDGGRIDVSLAREGAEAVLRVRDSGIGIAPELLASVFEPFVQVAPAIDRSQGGIGIGLTLVKELAALHGGSVDAASVVGEGSVFTLRIPAIPADEAALASTEVVATRPSERRVLVVDDNIDSAEMLVELLAMWGHTAVHAPDGPHALALAPEFAPDIVLLDIGLPGLDGYEVARLIRQDRALDRARIIAMTGYGQAEDRQKTKSAGFTAHLVKPIDFEELRVVLGE